jgi:hypothetical protein
MPWAVEGKAAAPVKKEEMLSLYSAKTCIAGRGLKASPDVYQ